jgi:uncharacterized protein YukE
MIQARQPVAARYPQSATRVHMSKDSGDEMLAGDDAGRMHPTADPRHFDALARQARSRADQLRQRARSLGAAVATMRWESVAATGFRDDADGLLADLRRCADRADHLAEALDRHADVIRTAEAALAHAANAVRAGASTALHGVESLAPW